MKKITILVASLLLGFYSFSQTLQKGNLLGIHEVSVELNGKTTMQEFVDFFTNKYAPAFAKAFSAEIRVLKYVRGEAKNKLGYIFIIKNEAERNKYFNQDGSFNAAGKQAFTKVKSISDELDKLGKTSGGYTDWIVQ